MAYDYTLLRKDVEAVILAAWPDVTVILDVHQSERRSLLQIGLPFAVYEIGYGQTADWGLVNVAVELPVDVHYACKYNDQAPDLVRRKVEVLKSGLYAASFAASQATLLEIEEDITPEHPMTGVTLTKNIVVMAGMLRCRFVLGETAT